MLGACPRAWLPSLVQSLRFGRGPNAPAAGAGGGFHAPSSSRPLTRGISVARSPFGHKTSIERISDFRKKSAKGGLYGIRMASSGSHSAQHRHTNRLVGEESPYLLQHAHNPVDWYPWGEEAFSLARAENKPIFLSIGYSTCHWCHVMEHESFENEEVAELMNKWFVNIKVDREERPDVDKVYMTYVQATQGGGGWPMSVFLTPDLKPILAGTYFPPDDKFGRIGFKNLLKRVREVWDARRTELEEGAEEAISQLQEASRLSSSSKSVQGSLSEKALELCADQLSNRYDSKLGGFGRAPKFPRPSEINVLFRRYYQLLVNQAKTIDSSPPASSSTTPSSGSTEATTILNMAIHTLENMARGGIHDHLGGGFHRYSVDEYWHVPHFEKMLYDQAQLANAYLDAFIITGDTRFSVAARDILDYLRRDMTHPLGGIFSAEDADSKPKEGGKAKEGLFYIWKQQEIQEALESENAGIFCQHYYVKEQGNCDLSPMSDPHHEFVGYNVLIEKNPSASLNVPKDELERILGNCRKELFAIRSTRPRPHLDDKIITSWNGLTISAFSRAFRILKSEPPNLSYQFPVDGCNSSEYLHSAVNAASFIRTNLYDENTGRLRRSYRKNASQVYGFADDYAFLISGLIDLYETNGDVKWLDWAINLQKVQDELFLDKEGGGYFNTQLEEQGSILIRMKEDYDGAEPSANSIACSNLVRLSCLLAGEEHAFIQTAEHTMAVFSDRIRTMAMAVPQMCCAFDSLGYQSKCQVLICGKKSSSDVQQFVDAAFSVYSPHRIVVQIDVEDAEDVKFWQTHNPNFLLMAQKNRSKSCALVCREFICLAPVFHPSDLKSLLLSSTRPTVKQMNFNIKI